MAERWVPCRILFEGIRGPLRPFFWIMAAAG